MEPLDRDADLLQRAMSALGEPHRFRLSVRLSRGVCSVGDLVVASGWPQPLVSHHLAVLHRAGLADVTQDGRRRLYRMADPEHPALRSLVQAFRAALDAVPDSGLHAAPHAATSDGPVAAPGAPPEAAEEVGPASRSGSEIEDYLL